MALCVRLHLNFVLFCLLCLLFTAEQVAGGPIAVKPTFSVIYVFGDSYCDVGKVYAATRSATPPFPYYAGRFANGPIWLEHVASTRGVPLLRSLVGGTDYAFGGALMTPAVVTTAGIVPNVPQQVKTYLAWHGGKADPKALYVLEGGGNDILGASSAPAGTVAAGALGTQIAREIAQSEYFLRLAGATKFLIPDLLDVSLLPAAAANRSFASKATKAVNSNLDVYLAFDQQLRTVKIYKIDVFRLFSAVATHVGFTDITTPCPSLVGEGSASRCTDPDRLMTGSGMPNNRRCFAVRSSQ